MHWTDDWPPAGHGGDPYCLQKRSVFAWIIPLVNACIIPSLKKTPLNLEVHSTPKERLRGTRDTMAPVRHSVTWTWRETARLEQECCRSRSFNLGQFVVLCRLEWWQHTWSEGGSRCRNCTNEIKKGDITDIGQLFVKATYFKLMIVNIFRQWNVCFRCPIVCVLLL